MHRNKTNSNSVSEKKRNDGKANDDTFIVEKKKYSMDCTIRVEGIHTDHSKYISVIEGVEDITGLNTVLAVVENDGMSYDVTLNSKENAMKLLAGVDIENRSYNCSLIFSRTTVVSFMKLPSFIEDDEIRRRLESKGIKLVSQIYRRAIPGTQVTDGTRFVKCIFPPGFVSLPWSMGFKVGDVMKYYRVVHNNQAKVCSQCFQPDHIQRDCPFYKCDLCGVQGHTQRRCKTPKCIKCKNPPLNCICSDIENVDDVTDDVVEISHPVNTRSYTRGRQGFGIPSAVVCEKCEKFECSCKCINCDNDPCLCSDICHLCKNDPCLCPCVDCNQQPCECINYVGNSNDTHKNDSNDSTIQIVNSVQGIDEEMNVDNLTLADNVTVVNAIVHNENCNRKRKVVKLNDVIEEVDSGLLRQENEKVIPPCEESISGGDDQLNESKKIRRDASPVGVDMETDGEDEHTDDPSCGEDITTGGEKDDSEKENTDDVNEKVVCMSSKQLRKYKKKQKKLINRRARLNVKPNLNVERVGKKNQNDD